MIEIKFLIFSKVKIRVAYTSENRNNSYIFKEAFEKALPTIYNYPIIGEFIEEVDDFGGHGGKIVELESGKKYYTKSKFCLLDAGDVDGNTKIQENAQGYILIKEFFGLDDITRLKAEDWLKWANENMDKVLVFLNHQ